MVPALSKVPGYVATVAEQENILLYIKKVTLKNVITSLFGRRKRQTKGRGFETVGSKAAPACTRK